MAGLPRSGDPSGLTPGLTQTVDQVASAVNAGDWVAAGSVPRRLRRRRRGLGFEPPASDPSTDRATSADVCMLADELYEQDSLPTVEQLQRYQQLAPDEIAAQSTKSPNR